ncbi:MAG: hypothetical protein K940chlam8_00374 [Chlamydiae bacterium]|nr:hypothetical protein [Chlamydiota bacterium]
MLRFVKINLYFILFFATFAIFANPPNPIYKTYQAAQKALQQKDTIEAKKHLKELIRLGPTQFQNPFLFFDIYLQLISLEIKETFYKDAKEHIARLKTYKVPKEVTFAIGFLKAELKTKEESIESAYIALQKLKKQLDFASWPQEQKTFHHAISFQQDQAYDMLLAKADEAFQNKDFPLALRYFEKIACAIDQNLYPKASQKPQIETHLYFYAAKTLSNLKEDNRAIQYYKKLLETLQTKKDLVQIQFEIGASYYRLKDYNNATQYLQHVTKKELDTTPFFMPASLLQIQAYYFLNEIAKGQVLLIDITKDPLIKKTLFLKIANLHIEYLNKEYSKMLFECAQAHLQKIPPSEDATYLKIHLLSIEYTQKKEPLIYQEIKRLIPQISSLSKQARIFYLLCHRAPNPFEKTQWISKLLNSKYSHTNSYKKINVEVGKTALQNAKQALLQKRHSLAKKEFIEAEKRLSIAKKMETDPFQCAALDQLIQECLQHLYTLSEL